ncbi:hypothetical protein F3J23_18195 [Chryseobacterium sp. Tr-659]|uniref:hypothetical protein n=1 Tax=Chryseobacterium sp. Tr-659 TaxID=2608340 RepID=UPI00142429CF|nr:hypothetical protein [Chryseobacterium sp. Tr-659]NIF07356.1 hypothetical protein [Chryseobacterium sp. Tr-659]
MKNIFALFLISIFALQSCSINSEIVYHKDAASTSLTDINTKEFMAEMMAMTPDSLKEKSFGEMNQLPTTWTNMYDLASKEGKLNTENQDTIRIMKKIYMKSVQEDHQPVGFSFKIDHFTPQDYQALKNFTKDKKLPLDQNNFNNWDGKILTIDTENFNLKNLEEAIRTKSSKEEAEKMEGMMMMFFKNIGTTLRFDNKIKSVTGKHDWVKQIDDYSVRIEYNLKTMYDKNPTFKNADKKITIVTE